jgi:hypothetical protein
MLLKKFEVAGVTIVAVVSVAAVDSRYSIYAAN